MCSHQAVNEWCFCISVKFGIYSLYNQSSFMYLHPYTQLNTHFHIRTQTYVITFTNMRDHQHCTYTHIYTDPHIYINVHMYTYRYINIHIYIRLFRMLLLHHPRQLHFRTIIAPDPYKLARHRKNSPIPATVNITSNY